MIQTTLKITWTFYFTIKINLTTLLENKLELPSFYSYNKNHVLPGNVLIHDRIKAVV